jgi:hypothetical protein
MEGESRLFVLPVCSEKRFIFFSIYPLTSFLTGLAKCIQTLLHFDEKLQLKLQTCNLVLHIDRSAWQTFLDSHLTHVQLGMCRTPLCRSCTFWFTGVPNNKWCHHNNLLDWWTIWNGWVFGVSLFESTRVGFMMANYESKTTSWQCLTKSFHSALCQAVRVELSCLGILDSYSEH